MWTITTDIETWTITADIEKWTITANIETWTITADIETWTITADIEKWTITADIETWTITADIETWTITADIETWTITADIEKWTITADIETWTITADIETWTITADIETWTITADIEKWTITADIERRIQALKIRCFRKLRGISYRDHITNEEVKTRIGHAIGPYEDLLTSVKRRKLKWYGHVTRSSGLAETVLQGTVQGGGRSGRQRKRWEGDIKEWTGLEWNIILRKAERKLVVKSTMVPRRLARLRDR